MLNYNHEIIKREQFGDFVREADVERLERAARTARAKRSPFYAIALCKLGALLVSAGNSLEVRFQQKHSALAH